MKTYNIKEEYIDNFGSECYPDTIITEEDVNYIARGWEMSVEDVLEMLIER